MLEETIELSIPQYDFLTSEKKHTGFVAGFGSGKSFIGTLKSLNKIINYGIPKTAYYLPTYGDIRDIAFDGFPIVADMLGYDFRLNKTDKEFVLLDGKRELGKTIFRNMSEPESIVGYQVGYTLIDETDILKQVIMDKAYKKILGRNRLIVPVTQRDILEIYSKTGILPDGTYLHNKLKKLCWINSTDVAGTPEGFKWFYSRMVQNFNEETDVLIQASTYSNLHNLPDDFIETLRAQYPPHLFEAYVNGIFVNLTSGTVYSYFDRHKHHSNEEAKENDTLFIGQDFNVGGCVSTIHVIRGNNVIRVDEMESKDTFNIPTNIRKVYQTNKVVMFPDASGKSERSNATKSDIQILRDAGFTIEAPLANGRIIDRVNAVNGLLSHGRYLINTNKCPKGTEALEQQVFDKNGDPEKFTGAGTIDDYNDSFGYFVVRRFPLTKNTVSSSSFPMR